jgi:hypothetical protein
MENLILRYFFSRADYFTAGFWYLPDMPIPGSCLFWTCRICPYPAIMPRALFDINILVITVEKTFFY